MTRANFKVGSLFDESASKMTQKEIVDNLEALAYKVVNDVYTKQLTSDELAVRKSRLAEVSIKLAEIEQKRKEYLAEIKAMKQEPKQEHGTLLDEIKHRSVRVEGRLFLVDDQEANMMYSFSEDGICVDARPLAPTEKQMVMKLTKKSV